MWTGENCPTAGRDAGGLFAGSGVNVGTIPAFATSSYAFEAPAGTSIAYLAARYTFHRAEPYWRLGVFADGTMLHGCEPAASESGCFFNSRSTGVDSEWGFSPGIHRVAVQTTCASAGGCRSDAAAPSGDRAGVRLYSASVRISDDSAPAAWDVGDGPLTNGAWQRGSQYVGFAAGDNVGIRRTRLYVDGRQLHDDGRDCDFTRPVPCSDVTYARYTVDTAALADGDHQLRVETVDTAGNPGSLVEPFRSDNTAPDAPTNVVVDGGQGWRRTNAFRVSWRNPASASPISIAHYELCNVATGACTTGGRSASGIDSIGDLSVPAPGDYTLRLTLQDYAGNLNPANRSVPVHLRFDDVRPGRAVPAARDGWIDGAHATGYVQRIELDAGAVRPVSGIAGYSVSIDGSDPDETLDVAGGAYTIGSLPEGVTTFKARAISGSGVASREVGSTLIRVDRTRPVAAIDGAPDPAAWQSAPVTLGLSGQDQAGLSGVALLRHQLDGGPVQTAAGASTQLPVAADGVHVVRLTAVDAAGNESAERSATFRIDRTAPELVVFEAPDSGDPRRVVLAASDQTSGIASGTIEIRTPDGWRGLATARDGDRFVAVVDDERLERGRYELRARVTDAAGNESVGDRRRDGQLAYVDTGTLRADSRLSAGLVQPPVKATCRKPKKRGGKKKCTAATTARVVSSLLVKPGRAAQLAGSLTTAAGAPVADELVEVYSTPAGSGAAERPLGVARTDGTGAFTFKVPRGESRSIRIRFGGSPHLRPSEAAAAVRVPARATLKSSRRSARNRQTVTFSGKLVGGPIPAGGKLLALQAFYRGKWRTFATPRASARKGRWSYRYRFGATRGRVTYRFRVRVTREAAYPYDVGYSKTVSVRVTGG